MSKRKFAIVLAGLILTICPVSAYAHGVMIGTNDFIAGLLHPLTALEDALPIFMLGILAGQNGLHRSEFIFWLFPLAIGAGALLAVVAPGIPAVSLVNILSMVILGTIVALGKRSSLILLTMIAVFFGLSHGYGNGMELTGQPIRPIFFISGVGLAALLLVAYGTAITDFLLKRQATWIPIALRVSGSWSAAIGLLVLSVSNRATLLL